MQRGGGRITEEVLKLVEPIIANELATSCLDGINWALVKSDRPKVQEKYNTVRKSLTAMGFKSNEVMRVFKAPNGLIYDFDSVVLKRYLDYLMEGTKEQQAIREKMSTAYEQNKSNEMFRLADFVEYNMNKGIKDFKVCLFNRTNSGEVKFIGKGQNGQILQVKLFAFSLRHCDLQECNLDYIMPRGFSIDTMEVIEILPGENGISYILHCNRHDAGIGNY